MSQDPPQIDGTHTLTGGYGVHFFILSSQNTPPSSATAHLD
jgi:hypothetical protein